MDATKIFSQKCTFLMGITHLMQAPDWQLPEFAFFGRSNVGKSSLINKLVNRKKLVKVSKEPGKTKEINFFKLGETCILADIPGYGYAKTARRNIYNWNKLLLKYAEKRWNLKRIYLLLDSKIGLKDSDMEVMQTLDIIGISYALVLTKVDKLSVKVVEERKAEILNFSKSHPAAFPAVFAISAKEGSGILELQENMLELCQ